MRAVDLYNMKPEISTKDLVTLKGTYYNHVPELNELDWLGALDNDKVEIKTLKYFNFDGRRFWSLATVWFDGKPIMIIQNAGRGGDDHAERFITSRNGYHSMVKYIHSLIIDEIEISDFNEINTHDDIPDLVNFYGKSLTGHFERF